jgi:hypothetical protein
MTLDDITGASIETLAPIAVVRIGVRVCMIGNRMRPRDTIRVRDPERTVMVTVRLQDGSEEVNCWFVFPCLFGIWAKWSAGMSLLSVHAPAR